MSADGGQQPDLNVSAAPPQAVNGVGAGALRTDRVDRDVTAASREVVNLGGDVHAPPRQYGVGRAKAACQLQGSWGAVDGDHLGPSRDGDLHRTEADATHPDDRDPLPRADACPRVQRPVRGRESTAKRCGGRVIHQIGDRDQIGVGRVQGDPFGEGPQCVNPGCVCAGHTCACPA